MLLTILIGLEILVLIYFIIMYLAGYKWKGGNKKC